MTKEYINEAIKARTQAKIKNRLKTPLKRISIKGFYEFYKPSNNK